MSDALSLIRQADAQSQAAQAQAGMLAQLVSALVIQLVEGKTTETKTVRVTKASLNKTAKTDTELKQLKNGGVVITVRPKKNE